MKNRYLNQLIVSLLLSAISVVLTIFYFVQNNAIAFGLCLSCTIFNIFKSGYYWNDYSAMTFMLKTMKEYLNDLENIVNQTDYKE